VATRYAQTLVQTDVLARHRGVGPLSEGAFGFRHQHRDIETGGTLRTPSTGDQQLSAFVVEQVERGRLQLVAGARYEWARYAPREKDAVVIVNDVLIPVRPRVFSNLAASVGALVDAGAGWRIGGSIARAFRTPDFNELYSNGPHLAAYSYDVGNPALAAETGLGADLFARYARERVRGELTLFENRLSGFIFPRNTGDIGFQGNRPKFQFTGRDATLRGAEGALDVAISARWRADASLSLVQGRFVGAVDSLPADSANGILFARPGSRDLPLMPPAHGHLGLRYDGGRAGATGVFAGVTGRFGAAQRRIGDFETPTDAYALLELDAGVRMLHGGHLHTLTLRVDNALDATWRNHLSRTKEIRPEAGRNLSLLYRVAF
jgi:iron complex outermembrane receptor protein